jgi:poly(A) polymerase
MRWSKTNDMIRFTPHDFPSIEGAYMVGGSVRDLLLDRRPADYDIAVLENPEKYADLLAKRMHGRVVRIGKQGLEILRVVSTHGTVDVSPVRGESILTDLIQRDFTINAIAYDLTSNKLIDPLDGRFDLEKKMLRMASKEIFRKDPVRLVRAYRIGALLGFTLDAGTISSITANARLIRSSAPERIRQELFQLLALPNAYDYLSGMADTGLLTAIVPELSRLRGCLQNSRHDYDVYGHTLRAICHLEDLINRLEPLSPVCRQQARQHLTGGKRALLKWAMLLHDIGKPLVRTIDNQGNIRFYGHPRTSADLAAGICKDLRFSSRETEYTRLVVQHHMRPFFLYSSHHKGTLTRKGRLRFFMACGAETPGVLLHAMADRMGKKETNENRDPFIDFINILMDDFFSDFSPKKSGPALITGHDLIREFGLPPSPIFKSILGSVEEARFLNDVKNREEALHHARNFLGRAQNKSAKS